VKSASWLSKRVVVYECRPRPVLPVVVTDRL
jgi:hypothetical protein